MPYDEIPPVDADWWDYETLISMAEARREAKSKTIEGSWDFPQ